MWEASAGPISIAKEEKGRLRTEEKWKEVEWIWRRLLGSVRNFFFCYIADCLGTCFLISIMTYIHQQKKIAIVCLMSLRRTPETLETNYRNFFFLFYIAVIYFFIFSVLWM